MPRKCGYCDAPLPPRRRKWCSPRCGQLAWKRDHPERNRANGRAWTSKNPDYQRDYLYKRKYGISLEDYERLLESQGGRCAICGRKPGRRRLAVDHSHVTGTVRALLCSGFRGCNKALGAFERDPDVARAAAKYLVDIAKDLDAHALTKMSHSNTNKENK